MRQETESSN